MKLLNELNESTDKPHQMLHFHKTFIFYKNGKNPYTDDTRESQIEATKGIFPTKITHYRLKMVDGDFPELPDTFKDIPKEWLEQK